MRQVVQPGPVAARRIEHAAGRWRERRVTVPAGATLIDAAAAVLAAGLGGGAIRLDGLRLSPFAYVMPAESPDADHVAFYSETFRPGGETVVESGTATIGRRDGAPFLHAHARWQDAAGRAGAGHILPAETRLAAPAELLAWGVAEAEMRATPDPETNFTLFRPHALAPAPAEPDAVLGWLRPGVDLVEGVEALCREYGAPRAHVRSIVGSIAGAAFEDGRRVETLPTEFYARAGLVSDGVAALEIVLVDQHGTIIEGRPVRGANPVLICAEIVLGLG